MASSKRPGLWANIHAKRQRIAKGSGEKMRKPGSKGAPTAKALRDSQTSRAQKNKLKIKSKKA
tara:strand:- start:356 stop:544 length:189 start_codon:yes stop_codon:yes gene_type:complete